MTLALTGGCQCGAVRYAADVDPAAYFCHCRMCQRQFGHVHAVFAQALAASVRWTGRGPDWFASSAIAERGFCRTCGTPVAFRYPGGPKIDLAVGSLDDPSAVRPTSHFGVESRVEAWRHTDGLPEQRADDYAPLADRWARAGATPP